MTEFPILYSRTKGGSIQQWRIWTVDDAIHVEHGLQDGKKQLSIKRAETTNEGRANERDPIAQAKAEAASMHRKKIDKGYRTDPSEAMDVTGGVMLAQKYEPKRIKGKRVFSSRKLDGTRCMAFWEGGEIVLMSRGGKPYTLPHIQEALAKVLPHDMVLDGELYCHGVPLQTVVSWVKRYQKDSLRIAYHVYDVPSDKIWVDRLDDLHAFFDGIEAPELVMVDAIPCADEEILAQYHSQFLADGYEGSMVRTHDGEYEYGKRSYGLLKMKDFQDAEFPIVDIVDGRGKMEGCAILVCGLPTNETFQCVMKDTLDNRRKMYEDRQSYIGKLATVKFFNWTNGGVPQFPVGIAIRDYE